MKGVDAQPAKSLAALSTSQDTNSFRPGASHKAWPSSSCLFTTAWGLVQVSAQTSAIASGSLARWAYAMKLADHPLLQPLLCVAAAPPEEVFAATIWSLSSA
eukprot:CAMPEP_0204527138 /NCGR_PEP_ID=MMETSP0661-20131031/8815_1 /ASSEMBLY_ACC=CAM_ASM_000606 /TAXON_ID=109239 /ORGANISM="Alexandrium margalefi, Strain AMGDE01CS-322" /LENGTH=101 /DNA_ID=CAMNT_0051533015 /DNA_START=100 /DNA_END=405 /DNA_ORIENTATION=-